MKKLCSIFLCICLTFSLAACGKEKHTYNLDFSKQDKKIECTLSNNDISPNIHLKKECADSLKSKLDGISVEFPYNDLYQTEECYKRLQTKIDVKQHRKSALNSSGKLTPEDLLHTVKQNNEDYLADKSAFVEAPEDDYIIQICRLIVDTVEEMKKQYPDVDWNRVYCNLGNLKIMYKKGMVDNAQVTADMVMNISPNMFKIVDIMSDENGCRDVVIHEIMHIIQVGCPCEEIEHCTRRCGISFRWDDFEFNTSDFGWLFEGSAERAMCNLTGDEPFTYKYMINYICSLNLCTMLNQENPANYAETLSFFDDPNLLFKMFDCSSKEDCIEILNMMIAINIIQRQPDELMKAYGEQNNVDFKDQSVIDDLNCTLKPAIVTVFTKYFYKNLIGVLEKKENITLNDVCYLISLFEATLDNHIKYTKTDYDKYNKDFIELYRTIRAEFFECIDDGKESDIIEYYRQHTIYENEDDKIVRASLKWCQQDKVKFFLERTAYFEFNVKSKVS